MIISKYLNIDCITQPPTSFIFISTWTRWRRWAKRSSNSVFGQVASSWWSWLSWWSQPSSWWSWLSWWSQPSTWWSWLSWWSQPSSSSSSSQSPSPTRSRRWHHRLQLPWVVLRRCVMWDQKLVIVPNLTSSHLSSSKGCPFFNNPFWHCRNSVCPSPPFPPPFCPASTLGHFSGDHIFYPLPVKKANSLNFTQYMPQTILARVLTPVSLEVSEQGELEIRRVKICFRHRVRVCRRARFRYLSDQLCRGVQVNLKTIHEVYDNLDDDDNHNDHHNYDRLPHSDDDNQVCTCQLSS